MPANLKHRIIRKRRIVKGHGIRDDIISFGRRGITYLKHGIMNGARRLVPMAAGHASSLARSGLHHLGDIAGDKAASVMHNMSNYLQNKMIEKTGGSVARPGRSMILREINHAMARSSIRRH